MYKSATIIAPSACLFCAVAVLAASFIPLDFSQVAGVAVAAWLLAAGVFLYIWAALRNRELEAVVTLPGALDEVRKAGREFYRNTAAIQENSLMVQHLQDELAKRVEEMSSLRKPLEDLVIEQRQQAMVLREELEKWQKTVVRFYEYLERSLCLEGLHSVQTESYGKVARELARELKQLGFEVIAPSPGEPFDEQFHEWKGDEASKIAKDHVVVVEHLGFRIGTRCLKPALVVVSRGPIADGDDALVPQPQAVEPAGAAGDVVPCA